LKYAARGSPEEPRPMPGTASRESRWPGRNSRTYNLGKGTPRHTPQPGSERGIPGDGTKVL
jgi:hypothetical protein